VLAPRRESARLCASWRATRCWDHCAQPLEPRTLLSTLLPIPSPRDLVFDPSRGVLYASSFGDVARYDAEAGRMLDPWHVGFGALNGVDVTADGGTLYAADSDYGPPGKPAVVKIGTSDGAATRLQYTPNPGEYSPWDVAVAANGKVLFTAATSNPFGFPVPFRQIDPATGAVSIRPYPSQGGLVRENMMLARGADGAVVVAQDAALTPLAEYDAAADTFPRTIKPSLTFSAPAAVSRDSSLIALRLDAVNGTYLFDRSFNFLRTLPGIDGGMAFDPAGDVFYGVDSSADRLVAFDTRTWRQKYSLPVGQDVGRSQPMGPGAAAAYHADDGGGQFFLATGSGVRVIDLPAPTGQAAWFELSGFPALKRVGVTDTLTLTVRDPAGELATGYRGTVHFSSTDPGAGLPADYAFTAADAGVHTFAVTFNNPGTHSVSVTDAAGLPLTASQSGITVHGGSLSFVPLTNPRGLVYDNTRDRLYVTTVNGTVERYDVGTESLLAPIQAGMRLNGGDITPDGSALYVAEGSPSPNQALVHRVDLADGSVHDLRYPTQYPQGGALDVSVGGDGRALVLPDGALPLLQLNLSNGAFTERYIEPINHRDVRPIGYLHRGADRRRVLIQEADSPVGSVEIYDTTTDAIALGGRSFWPTAVDGAVSRDSSLFAMGGGIFDAAFNYVRRLPGIDGGIAFDPLRDVFYGVNSSTDQLIAFDTHTWAEKYRLPLGLDAPPFGAIGTGLATTAVSGDGRRLFLATPAGIDLISLPRATAQAVSMRVSGFPPLVRAGVPARFTLSVYDPAGNPPAAYRGTVRFSSSDVAAGLPAEYTFTAADAGTHAFTATLRTPGTQSLSAADVANPALAGSETGISVHGGGASFLPIPGARDLAFDDVGDRLYVSTDSGTVEAFDLATQSLLPSLRVGSSLRGIDVTADGSTLYAADPLTGPAQGVYDKVRLSDGSVTPLRYPMDYGGDTQANELAVAANGKVVTDNGSLIVGLRVYDVATDAASRLPPLNDGVGSVSRGADRRTVVLQSNVFAYVYDADAGAITLSRYLPDVMGGAGAAVSPDGSLIAVRTGAQGGPAGTKVLDRALKDVKFLPGLDGGFVFDRRRHLLYGVDSAADALVAFDTRSWRERFRQPVGENVLPTGGFGRPAGCMAASDDGRWLFLITPTGVRAFGVAADTAVVGRHLFYNHSAFDGGDLGAGAADDNAIAPAAAALLPGHAAGAANVTGYTRGINGVMIDLFEYDGAGGLGAIGPAGDFELAVGTGANPTTWSLAPAPARVTVRQGAGMNGSDRVTLTWTDGALRNTWLKVTVRPTTATALYQPDVFYFGSLVGETGDTPAGGAAAVDAADYLATRAAVSGRPVGVASRFDVNHDGHVNARDLADVRRAMGTRLVLWGPAALVAQAGPLTSSPARPITRGLFGTSPVIA
jgi:DNA-binding beta-propeller fold protein YncE